MKNIKDEIWILADDRVGNYSQAIGLADELGFDNKIVNISYGSFAVLPNLVLGSTLKGVNQETKDALEKIEYLPKYVIAAGRRTAPISLHLKKKSKNKIKIIHIMNPGFSHEKFDFIILPRHDRIKKSFKNVIRSIGSVTKVSVRAVKYECEKFANLFSSKSKKIALMIGGDTKKTKFDLASARELIDQSFIIAKNMGCELYIFNSRRTPAKFVELIKEKCKKSRVENKFFDFNEMPKNENPHMAALGSCDYFIVTADSVSMISEVCSTKKPVYIFDKRKIATSKHRRFHKSLFLEDYARKLDKKISELEDYESKKLDEARRIASIIKEKL